eukprot:SAG31_NODE_1854_length_7065_cov_43.480764_4_plen_496_part_00
MVKLNAEKLNPRDLTGTLWEQLTNVQLQNFHSDVAAGANGDVSHGPASTIDLDALQRTFEVIPAQQRWKQAAVKAKTNAQATEKTVLDATRARNCGILLQHLRLQAGDDAVFDALCTILPLSLSPTGNMQQALDTIELLRQCSPTREERQLLQLELAAEEQQSSIQGSHSGSQLQMSAVDKWFCRLIQAGFWAGDESGSEAASLEGRLQLMTLKLNSSERLEAVKDQLVRKKEAVQTVQQSEALRWVLHSTLEMGNFLNHGTRQGGAAGYTLSTLLKLADTRAPRQPKTSLLTFLAHSRYAIAQTPSATGVAVPNGASTARTKLGIELAPLATALYPLEQLQQDLTNLQADSLSVTKVYNAAVERDGSEAATTTGEILCTAPDMLVPTAAELSAQLRDGIAELMVDFDVLLDDLTQVASLFGERGGESGKGLPDARAGDRALRKLFDFVQAFELEAAGSPVLMIAAPAGVPMRSSKSTANMRSGDSRKRGGGRSI